MIFTEFMNIFKRSKIKTKDVQQLRQRPQFVEIMIASSFMFHGSFPTVKGEFFFLVAIATLNRVNTTIRYFFYNS